MDAAVPTYPFDRTVCACRLCTINCEHLPGALAPADLPRIAAHLGYPDSETFARECLLASDGAKVVTPQGKVVSLPTLVPAVDGAGRCRFLSAGRCTIHAVSPYGCAYIDAHMSEAEFRRRADTLYQLLYADRESNAAYTRQCDAHREAGRSAPPLETRRYRLAKAMKRERLSS